MNKPVVGQIKLQIQAGKANPAPPIGPALGQKGVNIMEFCKQFNAQTSSMGDYSLPVLITVYQDKSFTFIVKKPSNTSLLKKYFNIESGSKTPGREIIRKLKVSEILNLANQSGKIEDSNAGSKKAFVKTLMGSAKSFGIEFDFDIDVEKIV